MEILIRFYAAFQSVQKYILDLNAFVENLQDYNYGNLESIFQDQEGRQLLCEALYLYGIMLLVLDLYIPGIIRERLLVSFYRYSSKQQHRESNFDDVCKLLISTGFSNQSNAKRPLNYPETYFRRIEVSPKYLDSVISTLRSIDIYNQLSIYPLPEHRTAAFGTQAGMLVVCLLFASNVLHNHSSQMREVVDKFFADNWIVPLFMGITVNLLDLWEPYKSAREALTNTTDPLVIKEFCLKHQTNFTKQLKSTRDLLQDGFLTESFVMTNISKIMSLFRECNVTLRWLMLLLCHSTTVVDSSSGASKKCKQLRELVTESVRVSESDIFQLLLNTSQAEMKVKELLEVIVAEKDGRWLSFKSECATRCSNIETAFSGERLIIGIEKNGDLQKWFGEFSKEISQLNTDNAKESARKMLLLIQALEKIQEFNSIESNVQICVYLTEMRSYLRKMIDLMHIKEEMLIKLQVIGDLSYAWLLIDQYKGTMQAQILQSPTILIKLRTIFLKLSSALEIPLMRINEEKSEDLISVSHYFSHELVSFVRRVIQIIPHSIFRILMEIVHIRTNVLKPIPNRVEKADFKDYAQLDDRFRVAQLTYRLSVFTEGILMMKKTLVGVIELDPKLLLEEGIRDEFKETLSKTLSAQLVFSAKANVSDVQLQLEALGRTMQGYKQAFQYVQEYLNIYALRFFHEEVLSSIQGAVEAECDSLLKLKPKEMSTNTFAGRLAREVLRVTDPKTNINVDLLRTWFDRKTTKEAVDSGLFSLIGHSIAPIQLKGLDKIFSTKLLVELERLNGGLEKGILVDKLWMPMLEELENAQTTFYQDATKFHVNFIAKASKVLPEIEEAVTHIGHLQLLRCHIVYQLRVGSYDARDVSACLRNFNSALMIDQGKLKGLSKPEIRGVIEDLETLGLHNPLNKVFCDLPHSPYFALFWVVFVISIIPKMYLFGNCNTKTVLKKMGNRMEGLTIIYGLVTIFKQYNSSLTKSFLDYYRVYVKSSVESLAK